MLTKPVVGFSSGGMSKDQDDTGSTIGFVPKDKYSKTATPDENIVSATGGGNDLNNNNN